MNNYKNNEKSQNNNRRGYNNKKANKQPKVNPNEIKIPLCLPVDLNDDTTNQIIDVLCNTRFDKISIPLGISRRLIEDTVEDDNRVRTIGYIRSFDAGSAEFTVIIFGKDLEAVKNLGTTGCLAMDLVYSAHKDGSLRTITKFNITCLISQDTTEEAAEEINE